MHGNLLMERILKQKISAGDIVIVNLDPAVGDEKQKTRTCLVIESGGSPLELLIILPITEYHTRRSKYFFVPIPNSEKVGLLKPSVVDCYQIRTLSLKRLKKRQNDEVVVVGTISKTTLFEVRKRLALIFDITEKHISDTIS